MSVSYLNSSTASLSPDLCSLAYFELFYVIFVLFCYNFHKISFSFPTISSLSVTPRTLVTSNSQNGIPVRIVQRTFKTRRFPDPICWGSSCRDGLKLQNLCFPDVSLWFWCRGVFGEILLEWICENGMKRQFAILKTWICWLSNTRKYWKTMILNFTKIKKK